MADDHGGLSAERVEQAHHVADQVEDGVLVDRLRPIALAVAAHVGRDRMEARGGKRAELMAPGIPGFGKAVAQENQRSLALFGDVEANAVGLDHALRYLIHGLISICGLGERP
jgi:hypothetical protein